jgi:hypothetical protein
MQSVVAWSLLIASVVVVLSVAAPPAAAQPPFMRQLPAASQPVARPRKVAPIATLPRDSTKHLTDRGRNPGDSATPVAGLPPGQGHRTTPLPGVSQAMVPEKAVAPLNTSPRYSTEYYTNGASNSGNPSKPLAGLPPGPEHRAKTMGSSLVSPSRLK